jgi:hypothetical protein
MPLVRYSALERLTEVNAHGSYGEIFRLGLALIEEIRHGLQHIAACVAGYNMTASATQSGFKRQATFENTGEPARQRGAPSR